jgi:integrase
MVTARKRIPQPAPFPASENVQEKKLAPATFAKAVWALETLVYPCIGSRPIAKLNAADVLKVLKRIEGRGIRETAHRTRQRCSQVFRHAVQTERAAHDVTPPNCDKRTGTIVLVKPSSSVDENASNTFLVVRTV